jgi:RNA-binding protein 25
MLVAVCFTSMRSDRYFSYQADDAQMRLSKQKLDGLVADINRMSQDAANNGLIDKEKYVIPPHLHDLQEADLPETQRGLVISEIAQFRERAAKREREKMRDVRESIPLAGAPSGPKVREWGKPQQQSAQQQPSAQPIVSSSQPPKQQGFGKGAQGYSKPVGFVKADDGSAGDGGSRQGSAKTIQTDEELEAERKESRRRDEEVSFRDVSWSRVCSVQFRLTYGSVNVGMSHESERVYKPLSVLSLVIVRQRKRRIVSMLRCGLA